METRFCCFGQEMKRNITRLWVETTKELGRLLYVFDIYLIKVKLKRVMFPLSHGKGSGLNTPIKNWYPSILEICW